MSTAYELFSLYGLQAIGVDRIVAQAGVAKTTLYHHFRSKDDVALAVLELRRERWTRGWLVVEVERRGRTAPERLLAVFDAFDEWFRRSDYEGCLFTAFLLETRNRKGPVAAAASAGLAEVRAFVGGWAGEAGVFDPERFAYDWHILMLGAIIAAVDGDREAALGARATASLLLESTLAT